MSSSMSSITLQFHGLFSAFQSALMITMKTNLKRVCAVKSKSLNTGQSSVLLTTLHPILFMQSINLLRQSQEPTLWKLYVKNKNCNLKYHQEQTPMMQAVWRAPSCGAQYHSCHLNTVEVLRQDAAPVTQRKGCAEAGERWCISFSFTTQSMV